MGRRKVSRTEGLTFKIDKITDKILIAPRNPDLFRALWGLGYRSLGYLDHRNSEGFFFRKKVTGEVVDYKIEYERYRSDSRLKIVQPAWEEGLEREFQFTGKGILLKKPLEVTVSTYDFQEIPNEIFDRITLDGASASIRLKESYKVDLRK